MGGGGGPPLGVTPNPPPGGPRGPCGATPRMGGGSVLPLQLWGEEGPQKERGGEWGEEGTPKLRGMGGGGSPELWGWEWRPPQL